MKGLYYSFIFFVIGCCTISSSLAQNVTVSGSLTGNGTYATLSAAFTGISGAQTGANIIITLNSSFTETASASLGSNTWASVTIQPAVGAAVSITTSNNLLLELNGADYVKVDGLNSGGSSLTLDCSSTANTASTVKFINDATYNTITRCTIKGSSTGVAGTISDGGVVSFSSTSGTLGNDNNTVSYCDIGPSGTNLPYTCIRSYATSGKGNDNILIYNNNIHDFFNGSISGNVNSNGIYIVSYASGWTITSNRFYQTATRTFTVGGQAAYRTIRVSTNADLNSGNFNISNNIIGYANSAGTGTTIINETDSFAIEFETIILEGGINGALSTISGNIISNIDFTSARAPSSFGLLRQAFFGIYVDYCTASITNNIIGSTTGTGSITIHSRQITTGSSTAGVVGIISRGS